MAKHLHPDRPVYGLQVPGFDGVPMGYRPVEELATRYLAEVQTVQPHGPYLLGGLSFGGLIALEMAQLLDRLGESTECLVLLDTHRPTDSDIPRRSEGTHLQRIRRLGLLGKTRYLIAGMRRRLNDYRRMALIQLRMRTGRPLRGSLRDFHFWRMCRPEGYAGQVLFIASRGRAERRRNEWDAFLHDVVDLVEIDAEHDDLVVMPWIREVCEHLETGFEQAAAPRT
jgi:thioesterase domain-containing protein